MLKVWSSATKSQSRPEGPDPVSHPCRWIHVEMLKTPHIHLWKTIMPSGRRTIFSQVLHENLNKLEAPLIHSLANSGIPATLGPTGSSRMVGPSTLSPWVSS